MKVKEKVLKTGRFFRHVKLERKAINLEKRTAEVAFSSETPYSRYFGQEILDHDSQSIRLHRLSDGGALLRNHDQDQHIGVVESATIGEDRIGRAVVRFSKNDAGEAALRDVSDGILRHVSVGYFIHSMELEKTDDGQETYRVTDWEPIEISLVPIPADTTVGVGRAGNEEIKTLVRSPAGRIETISGERQMENEEDRAKGIVELGEQYGKYVTQRDVADAVRNGRSVEQFRETIMKKMESKHTDTRDLQIGLSREEVQQYSLARACAAVITGDWSKAGLERSANQAVERIMKQAPQGFYVPFDIFRRDFNVGTGSEAGNLVATELRTDMYVDVLRNKYVLGMLGVRILSGLTSNIDIPKKVTAGAISRVTEIQALTETNPNTGKISLTPKRFGGYVEYSKQALIQSSLAIEPLLRDDLLTGGLIDLQDQTVNGSGSGANMRGVRNTSGIGSVVGGTNGLAIAWSHLVDLEAACANANAEAGAVAGYLVNSKSRATMKKTARGTNLDFVWPPDAMIDANGMPRINGYRAGVSNTVPSNLTKGTSTTVCSSVLFSSDWSNAVVGLFGAPDIVVDPYSLATTGQVRITLNQYADFGVRQAAQFAAMDDALTP